MSGGKQSPRQKMIGMMYLVLTALLALNISKEIINAFITIDKGLVVTNKNFADKNDMTYMAFDKAKQNDEKKVAPIHAKAMDARKKSKDLCDYITKLRGEMVAESAGTTAKEGDTLHLEYLEKPDDYDAPTHFMIGNDPANVTGKAKDLSAALTKYFDEMVKLVPAKDQVAFKARIQPSYPALIYSQEQEKEISWEWYNFYHAPIVAAIAQLDRIVNDVKNAEGDVINQLYASISASDFKFDALSAKVIAPTSYVFTGDHYTADVLVVASSTTQQPTIILGDFDSVKQPDGSFKLKSGTMDSTTIKVSGGTGKYDVVAGSVGLQQWKGIIRMKKPDGTGNEYYPFKGEYMVAAPSAAVFLEKMNVFYIGVENPISISAGGVAPSDLQPSLTGGTLRSSGKPGSYIVTVSGGTEATLNVNAKTSGGNKSMGAFKFRVKRVPDPVCYVGNLKADGQMTKSELQGQSGVFARMENFDFDLKFQVISFVMSMSINGVFVEKKSTGPGITPEMKSMLAGAKPGNKVFFEQVTVKGPDGTMRKIPGVNIKVK
ncbi:MAG: gliding motility protein GldM [Bacteroidota bacterium]|nr:gliding motility protein GldM [Bacteroidota bacterium]